MNPRKPKRPKFDCLAAELPPEMILLVAMLDNQIDDLARLHARGLWRSTPQEIGGNLLRVAGLGKYEAKVAMEEWLLWSRSTEPLIEALEQYTPIRIDRGRIVSLAIRRSAVICPPEAGEEGIEGFRSSGVEGKNPESLNP